MTARVSMPTLTVTRPFKLTGLNEKRLKNEVGFLANLDLPGIGRKEIAIWHMGPEEEYQASDPDWRGLGNYAVESIKDATMACYHLAKKVRFYVDDVLIDQIPAPGAPTLIARNGVIIEIDWEMDDKEVDYVWKGTNGTLRAQLLPYDPLRAQLLPYDPLRFAANHPQFEFEEQAVILENDQQHIQHCIDAEKAKKPPPVFQLKPQPLLSAVKPAPPANDTTSSSAKDTADASKDNSTTTPSAPKKWYQTGIVGWFVDLLGKLAHLFCFWR